MTSYAQQTPPWAPASESVTSPQPTTSHPTASRSDDPRTATLEKLARLRDTLSNLQAPAARPSPALSQTDRSDPPGAKPEGAVDRILRRRGEHSHQAAVQNNMPQDVNEVRRQLGELTSAVAPRPHRNPRDDTATFTALRNDMSDRLDAYLETIDARVDRGLRDRGTDEMAAALRDLSARFDEETSQNAERQTVEAGRLAQHIDSTVGGLSDRVGEQMDSAVRRAQGYLVEHGAELSRENRSLYEQILSSIGELTDAFTYRLEHSANDASLAEMEARLSDLTDMMANIERNVNDAPVLRRVERELKSLLDPSLGLEARLNARFDTIDGRFSNRADDRTLCEINGKIDGLVRRLAEAPGHLDARGIASIEAEIQALQDRVLESSLRNEDLLREIAGQMSAPRSERADIAPVLAQIEERLSALQSQAMATSATASSGYAEEQIDTLVTRIEALVAGGGAQQSSAQLEHQLAILSERIDHYASAAQQGGVSRDEILTAVQQAAEQTLRDALDRTPAGNNGEAAASAVREGLAELRVAQESGDRRTKDTLETVRDTVERVFQRLEALERTAPTAAAPRPAPTPAPVAMAPGHDNGSSFAVGDHLRAAQDHAHDMPDDWAPIAPGGGVLPKHAAPSSAAPAEPAQNSRANFIAAARLAAQQSAQEDDDPEDAVQSDTESSLSRVRAIIGSRRAKPVLLAAAAVILALGTLKLLSSAVISTDLTGTDMAIAPVAVEAPLVTEADVPAADVTMGSETSPEIIARQVPIMPLPAGPDEAANLARLDGVPAIGSEDQFASYDAVTADLLAPTPALPEDAALLEPVNAASVQSALAANPTAPRPVAGPEPTLLAELPDAIGPEALRIAAASGDPKAQYEIARRFGAAQGVEKDDVEALAWLERAAAQDLAPAQYRLGSMYEKGIGTERDASVARAWYERAAAQGNARAMHNIGVLYAEGAFGEANFEEAVTWFEQGARFGVPDSQFNLGIIYGRGLGVPQDLAGSYMWFDASAKAGDEDAKAKRDEVAGVMDSETLTRAKAMSAELVIADPLQEANLVVLSSEMTGEPATQQLSAAEETMLIKQIQAVLTHRGYEVGPIDGIPGGRTATAIRAFQSANGLPPNGKIDEALLEALSNKG